MDDKTREGTKKMMRKLGRTCKVCVRRPNKFL
jgi:hypothetical protein